MKRLNLLVCATVLTAACCSADISTGLVGHWPLNGNLSNAVAGKGDFSSLVPVQFSSTTAVPGLGASSFVMKRDSCLTVATGMPTGPFAFTIAMWVKSENVVSTLRDWLVTFGQQRANSFMMASHGNFEIETGVWDSNSKNGLQSDSTVEWKRWRHIAVTFSGSLTTEFNIYIDGALATSPLVDSNYYIDEDTLRFGCSVFPNEESFIGNIADVRLYNRMLKGADVVELFSLASKEWRMNTFGHAFHYKFDSNFLDADATRAHDVNATLCSGTSFVTGETACAEGSGCLMVKSTSSCSNLPILAAESFVSVLSRPVTLAFWVKPMMTVVGKYGLLRIGNADKGISVFISASPYPRLTVAESAAASSGATVSLEVERTGSGWAHVVVVFKNDLLTFYINSVKLSADVSLVGVDITERSVALFPNVGEQFNGMIDDMHLYTRVLAPEEIAEIYQTGNAEIRLSLQNTMRYEFEENAKDSTGLPAVGEIKPGFDSKLEYGAGKNGHALKTECEDIDGVPTACSFYTNTVTNPSHPTHSDFTYAVWTRQREDVGNNKRQWVAMFGGQSAGAFIHFIEKDMRQYLGIWDGKSVSIPASELANKAWCHVAATYSRETQTLTVYVNGKYVGKATGITLTPFDNRLKIATAGWSGVIEEGPLNGRIDDMFIYSRVLSAGDILDLYNRKYGAVPTENSVMSSVTTVTVSVLLAIVSSVAALL